MSNILKDLIKKALKEVNDAAILPAIFPLFPTPDIIILPLCWEINSTALIKSLPKLFDNFAKAKDSNFITSCPTFFILGLIINYLCANISTPSQPCKSKSTLVSINFIIDLKSFILF